jgi:hypothetical protein
MSKKTSRSEPIAEASIPPGAPEAKPTRAQARTQQAAIGNRAPAESDRPRGSGDPLASHSGPETVGQAPGDAVARLESRSMASEPNEDDVRMRAYLLYLERGRRDGSDFDDWLRAERELKGSADA